MDSFIIIFAVIFIVALIVIIAVGMRAGRHVTKMEELPIVNVVIHNCRRRMEYKNSGEHIISGISDYMDIEFWYNGRQIVKENIELAAPIQPGVTFPEYVSGDSFKAYYSESNDTLYRCSDLDNKQKKKEQSIFLILFSMIMISIFLIMGLVIVSLVEPSFLSPKHVLTAIVGIVLLFFAVIIGMLIKGIKQCNEDRQDILDGNVSVITARFVGYRKMKHKGSTVNGNQHQTYYTYHPISVYKEKNREYYYIDLREKRRMGKYTYNDEIILHKFHKTGKIIMDYKAGRIVPYYVGIFVTVTVALFVIYTVNSYL